MNNEHKVNPDKVGALWLNTSKAGKEYYSGTINDEKVVVFTNGFKENENQPDMIVYKSKPQTSVITPEEVGKVRKTELETVNEEANEITNEDLPF